MTTTDTDYTQDTPCGVEIDDDTDTDGYSKAMEDHLRGCRECAAWERDHEDHR